MKCKDALARETTQRRNGLTKTRFPLTFLKNIATSCVATICESTPVNGVVEA